VTEYVAIASSRLENTKKAIQEANFFAVDWDQEIRAMKGPLLVIGNPPWVTSAWESFPVEFGASMPHDTSRRP
jgi:hypothetical protein